jgi:c-di-GMP-related signal transduction protein
LLFRSGANSTFSGDPERATRDFVHHYLMLMLEKGDGLAFNKRTRQTLIDETVTLLPPETTVLEILETIPPDAELIAACQSLRQHGYRFALISLRIPAVYP